jgi:hypothetical protein
VLVVFLEKTKNLKEKMETFGQSFGKNKKSFDKEKIKN